VPVRSSATFVFSEYNHDHLFRSLKVVLFDEDSEEEIQSGRETRTSCLCRELSLSLTDQLDGIAMTQRI